MRIKKEENTKKTRERRNNDAEIQKKSEER